MPSGSRDQWNLIRVESCFPVRGFLPRAHYNSLELSQSCANTNTVNVKTKLTWFVPRALYNPSGLKLSQSSAYTNKARLSVKKPN